jgi:acetoin utilization deacetylase AcuC-like enzyme
LEIIYSDAHRAQHGRAELTDGELTPCYEQPVRAERVIAELRQRGAGPIRAPHEDGRAALEAVHAPDYLEFLATAWPRWEARHGDRDALPLNWRAPGMRRDLVPRSIEGQLSHYSFDAGTPITRGTWQASLAAASVAASAQARVSSGAGSVLAVTRPPGHHAGRDFYGGYCYVNTAAVAVMRARAAGAERIAVLDVDYHHGNGTQEIFWDDPRVFTCSLHADPRDTFPFFSGHADETADGTNLNLPLPHGTDWAAYRPALDTALSAVAGFAPDALVVSLGVDTWEGDPISHFRFTTDDYSRLGKAVAAAGMPATIILEGGYGLEAIGANVAAFVAGFDAA